MFNADAVGLWTVDDWAGVKFIDSCFIKYIFKLLEAELLIFKVLFEDVVPLRSLYR